MSNLVSIHNKLREVVFLVKNGSFAKAEETMHAVQHKIPPQVQSQILGIIQELNKLPACDPAVRVIACKAIQETAQGYLSFRKFAESITLPEQWTYCFPVHFMLHYQLIIAAQNLFKAHFNQLFQTHFSRFIATEWISAYAQFLQNGQTKQMDAVVSKLLSVAKDEKELKLLKIFKDLLRFPHLLNTHLGHFLPELNVQQTFLDNYFHTRTMILKILDRECGRLCSLSNAALSADHDETREPDLARKVIRIRDDYIRKNFDRRSDLLLRQEMVRFFKTASLRDEPIAQGAFEFFGNTANASYLQVKDHLEYLLELDSIDLYSYVFIRDYNILIQTKEFRNFPQKWQKSKENNPKASFRDFLHQEVVALAKKLENPTQYPELFAEYRNILKANPSIKELREIQNQQIDYLRKRIQITKTLFHAPLQLCSDFRLDEEVQLYDELSPELVPPCVRAQLFNTARVSPPTLADVDVDRTDRKRERKESKRHVTPLPTVPSSSEAPSISLPQSAATVILSALKSSTKAYKDETEKSLQDARCHIMSAFASFERILEESDAPFYAVSSFIEEMQLAAELLLKAALKHRKTRSPDISHDLIALCSSLSFLSYNNLMYLRKINFAAINRRDVGKFAEEAYLSARQQLLSDALTLPLSAYQRTLQAILKGFYPFMMNLFSEKEGQEDASTKNTLSECAALLEGPLTVSSVPVCHAALNATCQSMRKLLTDLNEEDWALPVYRNLHQNLLATLDKETRRLPKPQEMRVHFTTIFESIPWIIEELFALSLAKKDVEKDILAFRHDFPAMAKAAGIEKLFSTAQIDFLNRAARYPDLRYPSTSEFTNPIVKRVAKCLDIVQGKSPILEKTEGHRFQKGGESEAYHELCDKAHTELQELLGITQILIAFLNRTS